MLIVDKLAFQEKLSEGEKTLAAYILAHGMEIAKYSTRSLAEVTYTSPPTVLRLCKKLGFTGFDDFKQNFVRELEYLDQQQGKVDFNFPFAENDSPMRVAQNIGELYEEAVKDTMQLLRYEDLHKAVLLLKYHEEIHIFSAGTAINQAESFREKMLKIGKRVVIFNNLNYQRYQACCLSERDLAMIISYSGETAQMLEIARQCKRSGTPILALTSFGENSLTCYADCKLTLSTKESIYQNLGDYASHLSMTLLLDILYSEYFRQNYQKMSCIVCIILNSLQHYEVRILFSFDVISPVSVTIIRIMVRYQHSLITFFLQNANIFFNSDFSIQRSLFCMAMHIKFHKKLLPETLFVLQNHIHRTLVFQLLSCLRRA